MAVQSINHKSNRMGRREFLLTIGVVSTASFAALASALKSLTESMMIKQTAITEARSSETVENTEAAAQITETPEVTVQPTETVQAATQTPTIEVTQSSTANSLPTESNCTIRCPRGCSYPGHCKR